MSKKWKPNITMDELDHLYEIGMTIRAAWISPEEGTEYYACAMGQSTRDSISIHKSARAAYNACVRYHRSRLATAKPDRFATGCDIASEENYGITGYQEPTQDPTVG